MREGAWSDDDGKERLSESRNRAGLALASAKQSARSCDARFSRTLIACGDMSTVAIVALLEQRDVVEEVEHWIPS